MNNPGDYAPARKLDGAILFFSSSLADLPGVIPKKVKDVEQIFRNAIKKYQAKLDHAQQFDRDKYASVKLSLAEMEWSHIQHYADEKNSIVKEIMDRANDIN